MLENLPDPALQNIIKFFEISGILKRIQRTGWVEVGVYEPESVADHTFRTAMMCMLYADIEGLDVLKVLRMALIHDLPEAVIGDLTPAQKNEETKGDEETAMQDILNLLPAHQRETYIQVWKEYQQGQTKEAKAVQQLEKIEMALQAKEYERFGATNSSLQRFVDIAKQVTSWPDLDKLLCGILEENKV